MSDIHLDGRMGWYPPVMDDEHEQVLILAGDVAVAKYGSAENEFDWFWTEMVKRFKEVIFVPGNHDYYRGNILYQDNIYRERLSNLGVTFLQENIVELEDVIIAGTTLWTDFGFEYEAFMRLFKYYMMDARLIKDENGLVNPRTILMIHRRQAQFLQYAAMITHGIDKPNVLVTHHMPNGRFVAPRWKGDESNYLFHATIDEKWLEMFGLVICGHTHDTMDFMLNNTRCLINPMGYGDENPQFNPRLVVEV